jgi:hypothetical protein
LLHVDNLNHDATEENTRNDLAHRGVRGYIAGAPVVPPSRTRTSPQLKSYLAEEPGRRRRCRGLPLAGGGPQAQYVELALVGC